MSAREQEEGETRTHASWVKRMWDSDVGKQFSRINYQEDSTLSTKAQPKEQPR